MRRTLVPAALICSLFAASTAWAGEEILIRNTMTFHECPAVISLMLEKIGADENHVQTISDTGAHYYVELESIDANLQFRCNAVTEQMEVARVTPGTLNKLASD